MRQTRLTRPQARATYARTGLDFLVNDPDGFPSSYPPGNQWWYGVDTGGGAYPIGPNGPFPHGTGAAVPAVIRSTALITGPITSAPFRVLSGTVPQPSPRWLSDPMLLRPDDRFGAIWPAALRLPRSLFWTEWLRSSIWWGMGAFVFIEDQMGQPAAGSLWNIDSRMLSSRGEASSLRWTLDLEPEPVEFDRDGRAQIGPVTYRLCILRNPHSPVLPDGRSLGVFEMAPQAFALAAQVDSYAQGTFRSGIPAGYLKVTTPGLTKDAADALKGGWMSAHGGDRRSIAVLNATTEFQPLNLSPVDAALGEVKRLSLADVAMAFGLDPMTLGVGLNNSATYSNLKDSWANHRDFGLAPWTAAVEDTLSALLPGQQNVKANLDGFANPTPAERYAAWKLALDARIITVEEVRAFEGLPPMARQDPLLPPAPAPAQLEQEPTDG